MQSLRLYAIVFLSGAAVLAIEILGTRILGPFYGVSLFLWSALITVTLAALSVGYALGGRWADRRPSLQLLGTLLLVAGVLVCGIPLVRGVVLETTGSLGVRAAVLVTSTLLFGPPLTLLGMVSPFAIRIKTADVTEVGSTSGNLYAVSTFASVVSALAVGFFLIPAMGVSKLLFGIGGALFLAATLAYTGPRLVGAAALCIVAVTSSGMLGLDRADPARGLVELRQTPYAEIRIVDVDNGRYLLMEGMLHTVMDLEDGRSWHRYVAALDILDFLFDEPGDMLLLGLGGGLLAQEFSRDGWNVQAVEIDPAVTEIAREYFDLRDEHASVAHMDGRRFLHESAEKYDLIIGDAYGTTIPFHLATREAFAEMAARLRAGGILALNVETLGWDDELLSGIAASLEPSFEYIFALPTSEPPNALGNVIVLAANRELEFDEMRLPRPHNLLADEHAHWWALQMNHGWDNRYVPETAGVRPFTDDRTVIDLLSERVNRAGREQFHERFGRGLGW